MLTMKFLKIYYKL